jgi:Protein of unknown function (DUF3000)
MRLADTPAPVRASAETDAVPAGPGESSVTDPGDSGARHVFPAALAAFKAGADAVAEVRDDLSFEDLPAPKRLAPHAVAMAATAYRDGVEAGTGRLVLLHDPAGQEGWTGTFRLVVHVHADVEEEMAADPMLGEVGWSWLTDALDLHAPGYSAPSGTVTRVITEGYGTKADEPPMTAFELRASWCPADDEIDGSVAAWCDLLVAAGGLPTQPPGTLALNARAHGSAGRRRRR